MKKKILGLILAGVTVLTLSGCGGGDTVVDPLVDNATTLFLIDQNGNSYGGIPYICDSMVSWSATRPNGEFTFFPPDDCTFDFTGLIGNYANDPIADDIVYIVDDLDRGKENIPYECVDFGVSSTFLDGSFDYDIDDQCVFYL